MAKATNPDNEQFNMLNDDDAGDESTATDTPDSEGTPDTDAAEDAGLGARVAVLEAALAQVSQQLQALSAPPAPDTPAGPPPEAMGSGGPMAAGPPAPVSI